MNGGQPLLNVWIKMLVQALTICPDETGLGRCDLPRYNTEMGRVGGKEFWGETRTFNVVFQIMTMEIVFNRQGNREILPWNAWISLRIHKQEALSGPINADRQSSQRFPGRPSNFTSYYLNLVPITTTFIWIASGCLSTNVWKLRSCDSCSSVGILLNCPMSWYISDERGIFV